MQDENECDKFLHKNICGDAFALDPKSRLAVLGGQFYSSVIDMVSPDTIVKQIALGAPRKWLVTNYEWELCANSTETNRYLQSRDKVVEIVNCHTYDTLNTLSGHYRSIK